MNDKVQKAINVLNDGGIIIYPTDTAFGIGCKVSDEKAVERLFSVRKRAETKAVPVLIDSIEMGKKYVTKVPSDVAEKLMTPHWPGALTIVLPCKTEVVPSLVRGGAETIGLRIPDNDITLEIIRGVGEGIVGCSANFSGGVTPYTFADLDPELIKLVDYVVPGETNDTHLASTVIDCSQNLWKVLREGAIHLDYSHVDNN